MVFLTISRHIGVNTCLIRAWGSAKLSYFFIVYWLVRIQCQLSFFKVFFGLLDFFQPLLFELQISRDTVSGLLSVCLIFLFVIGFSLFYQGSRGAVRE
ncbi:hypothetical protein [Endozoicomonas sp. ALB115]|uniref:hypothetical protein n=1 Tax=Endozoicomonas sp. ALB115 TaxID=3403074 RepID=UPI003BB7A741